MALGQSWGAPRENPKSGKRIWQALRSAQESMRKQLRHVHSMTFFRERKIRDYVLH